MVVDFQSAWLTWLDREVTCLSLHDILAFLGRGGLSRHGLVLLLSQAAPSYWSPQWQTFGRMQSPPFWHSGRQMAISDEESFVKSIILKIYHNVIFRESVNFDIVVACKYFLRFRISFAAFTSTIFNWVNSQAWVLPGPVPTDQIYPRPEIRQSDRIVDDEHKLLLYFTLPSIWESKAGLTSCRTASGSSALQVRVCRDLWIAGAP